MTAPDPSERCARCGHENHGTYECNVPEGFPTVHGEESLCQCPAFVPPASEEGTG